MKKRLLILLLALLLLTGCTAGAGPTTNSPHTEPPLPELDGSMTPQQLLQAAADGLKEKDFTLYYGSGWAEELTLSTAQSMEEPKALVPNEHFFQDVSALELTVVPSKNGTMRYEVSALTAEQICRLLCGRSMTDSEVQTLSGYAEVEGIVEILVDAEGVFQTLQVDISLSGEIWTLKISVDR